jgi:hypothetical protein
MIRQWELDLINAFVVREKRERYLYLSASPRRRKEFLKGLYHFSDFDTTYVVPLARSISSAGAVVSELRRRGALDECYVISIDPELDGVKGELQDVISQVHGRVEGTIVSCIPGRLAYYEGEAPENRFILDRKDRKHSERG